MSISNARSFMFVSRRGMHEHSSGAHSVDALVSFLDRNSIVRCSVSFMSGGSLVQMQLLLRHRSSRNATPVMGTKRLSACCSRVSYSFVDLAAGRSLLLHVWMCALQQQAVECDGSLIPSRLQADALVVPETRHRMLVSDVPGLPCDVLHPPAVIMICMSCQKTVRACIT